MIVDSSASGRIGVCAAGPRNSGGARLDVDPFPESKRFKSFSG
jgi:hypothetical protein